MVNWEGMYEGKDISIVLDGKNLNGFILKDFVLEESINEHQKLNLQIETDISQKKNLENTVSKENVEVKIELREMKGKRKIFEGIVDYFEVLDYGSEGCRILIEAFSKSILLDRKYEKKYRVFQDTSWTFANIVEEINKDYVEKKIEIKYSDIAQKSVNSLIIQYDETDWEFLVRISSHLKTGMFVTEDGVITFGIIENSEIKQENRYFSDYSIVREHKNLYYKINSGKAISSGDTISINNEKDNSDKGSNLTVLKSKIFLKNYILKSNFLATNMESYYIYRKYNEKIKGSAIEVKVEKVFEENNIAKMEVTFFEGLNKIVHEKGKDSENKDRAYNDYGIKRIPLSYQTFYSQTNTGFFCTPEVNDNVEVYFPSEDENFARVSWAINNEGNGRFSDYEKRNFHINGKDFNFNIDKNNVTVNIEESYTRNSKTSNETAESFVNKGTKNLVVVSDDYIGIESIGEMSVYGRSIDIVGKEKEIRMETPNEIRIKGKKVHTN